MENRIYRFLICLLIAGTANSCSDYLNIVPKGEKIPKTLADFEALIRDEYSNHRLDVTQAILLLNDKYETSMYLNYYPLRGANYLWDETADRIALNNSDESTYYSSYAAISTFNLIIEHAPAASEASEAGRNELVAQAKILRAMSYFNLVNYYAETYQAAKAASSLAVPLITSADMGAPYTQVTVQALYDFILEDIRTAISDLGDTAPTPLHPTLGTAYAFKARVHLQMGQYEQALESAEQALAIQSALFNWVDYYQTWQAQIQDPENYNPIPSPMGYDYVENYNFRHGTSAYSSTENDLRVDRAARFETGDARFAVRWKLRTVGSETFYDSTTQGFYNYAGITTTEVYLIKAECLVRNNQIQEGMEVLNRVRKTRILPEAYAPLQAADQKEALELIRRTKDNELILTLMPFADARRFNLDPATARTLEKQVDGQTLSLTPDSHLWVMPFPQGAIDNPGNGTIVQNVGK